MRLIEKTNFSEESIKKLINENNYTYLPVRNCSLCNYELGYVFENGEVYYDCGCNSVKERAYDHLEIGYVELNDEETSIE